MPMELKLLLLDFASEASQSQILSQTSPWTGKNGAAHIPAGVNKHRHVLLTRDHMLISYPLRLSRARNELAWSSPMISRFA